ncbi:MAG TPA: alpha/beta hydrolase [Lapillicoccus sp.]|nr:alpha/beta hydrolase [Lapillicoccus sp.]
MQSQQRPGPPGPYATPDEIPAAISDRAKGGVRYADVEYARVMGYRPLRMDLLLPPTPSGPVPVVVWIHGGGWRFGSRLYGPGTEPVCRALLDRGIAVALVEHRFSDEALFPACLHDIKAAVRWLRRFGANVGVNGAAIGVWGVSSGGHLAALVAMSGTDDRPDEPMDERLEGSVGVTGCSSTVAAAVAWCAPTDFPALGPDGTGWPDPGSPEALLIGGPTRERREDAAFASPVTHVHPGAAPILLVHGLQDDLIPAQQSALLHEALQAVGATSELEWIDGAGHVMFGVDPDPIAHRSAAFLARHLT